MENTTKPDFRPYREREYRMFLIWKSLPPEFTKQGRSHLLKMGIDDEDILELSDIKTKKEFAEKYRLSQETMTEWDKNPVPIEYAEIDWRMWAKHLTRSVVTLLFEGIQSDKDAARITLWMKMVDGFTEESKIVANVTQDTLTGVKDLITAVNKAHDERSNTGSNEGDKQPSD